MQDYEVWSQATLMEPLRWAGPNPRPQPEPLIHETSYLRIYNLIFILKTTVP